MHIVVVDPSKVVHRVISAVLEPRGHYISAFVDSKEAHDYIVSDETVDVLLTSLEVTPLSGMELAWRVRTLGRPIYVVVMSSQANASSLAEALDSGADEFIEKPPRPEALIARLRAAERLLAAQRKLLELAERDPLSGLYNRRAFFARLEEALDQTSSTDKLSAIMFDIDHFKAINDSQGHDVGDEVIQAVSMNAASVTGIVGRLGGEEFAIILPGAPLANALELAEGLRQQFDSMRYPGSNGLFGVTCSFGVSEYVRGDTAGGLLKRADQALYAAKRGGRNQVAIEGAGLPGDGVQTASNVRHTERAIA
ncbi:MAG: diguanylate cyclase [Hyphomicrobiaceae bacterium]|nr:diguanylate cyclase [Hyphomicrobiaceae bacterium]